MEHYLAVPVRFSDFSKVIKLRGERQWDETFCGIQGLEGVTERFLPSKLMQSHLVFIFCLKARTQRSATYKARQILRSALPRLGCGYPMLYEVWPTMPTERTSNEQHDAERLQSSKRTALHWDEVSRKVLDEISIILKSFEDEGYFVGDWQPDELKRCCGKVTLRLIRTSEGIEIIEFNGIGIRRSIRLARARKELESTLRELLDDPTADSSH